jgi:hypothetical protein
MRIPYAALAVVFVSTGAFATDAMAVSKRVKDACRSDYRAYCSAHEVGSEALRSCMRSVKHKLSKRCRNALVESGEATPADIKSYKEKRRR